MTNLTPMIKQYIDIKEKYSDSILLFRLGDFYETFFEDAEILSDILQIVLTSRSGYPMAGIPHHALDNYLKKILDSGKKVAICEQMEEAGENKGIIRRAVTKIITPGTIIDEKIIDENSRYSLLINKVKEKYVIVIFDFTTGEVYLDTLEFNENELIDFITSYGFVQILMNKNMKDIATHIKNILGKIYIEFLDEWYFNKNFNKELNESYGVSTLEHLEYSEQEYQSLNAVFKYLETTQFKKITHMKIPNRIKDKNYMFLDVSTINNLSLLPEKDQKGKTLYDIINCCRTNMGKRLLREYISRPLLDKNSIYERQKIVEAFYNDRDLIYNLKEFLNKIKDIDRISTKISLKNINPKELIALKTSFEVIPKLKELLEENNSLKKFFEEKDYLKELVDMIEENIFLECSNDVGKGEVINWKVSEELDEYRELTKDIDSFLKKIEEEEKLKTSISTLKVGRNKIYGFYIEISKANASKAPEYYVKKQTLTNCERFTISKLVEIERKLADAENKIKNLEKLIYNEFIDKISFFIKFIKSVSEKISKLDVLRGFAEISIENNYIKPEFINNNSVFIKDSRHPCVEKTVDNFITNDFIMEKDKKLIILTGPNMSGKSTYIRQIGIINVMAQIGCFVPAKICKIPIYDRIFTRIGARDDIVTGKSTFLVEMLEMSTILNRATENSLVLLDEVGRGTGTLDGISVAWAISEYIFQILKSKTIFATHYTELTMLAEMYSDVMTKRVKVIETKEGVLFLHEIEEGISDKSYGVEVSKLAGFPAEVSERAEDILEKLSDKMDLERKIEKIKNIKSKKYKIPEGQLKMF